MSEAPDSHELARQVAVLEERMNTMQADLSATLERFRADMAARDTALADRIATTEDRNATARWWQTGALLAGIATGVAVIIAVV